MGAVRDRARTALACRRFAATLSLALGILRRLFMSLKEKRRRRTCLRRRSSSWEDTYNAPRASARSLELTSAGNIPREGPGAPSLLSTTALRNDREAQAPVSPTPPVDHLSRGVAGDHNHHATAAGPCEAILASYEVEDRVASSTTFSSGVLSFSPSSSTLPLLFSSSPLLPS